MVNEELTNEQREAIDVIGDRLNVVLEWVDKWCKYERKETTYAIKMLLEASYWVTESIKRHGINNKKGNEG